MKNERSRSVPEFRIRLTCGHETWARNPPMTDRSQFGCNIGLGCGYTLRWTEWWKVSSPDVKGWNKTYGTLPVEKET